MGPPNFTISGCIPRYTHLQPWLNRVCWGCNYHITRWAPFLVKPNPTPTPRCFQAPVRPLVQPDVPPSGLPNLWPFGEVAEMGWLVFFVEVDSMGMGMGSQLLGPSLKLTANSNSTWKLKPWKFGDSELGNPCIFRCYVRFRECIS